MLKHKLTYILILYMFFFTLNVFAKEVTYTLEDRDRLIRIEASLKEFKDSVDKRFEQVDKRFEQVINFMWMLVAIFVGITGATIGFAIWDRRSMIRPFETKAKEMEGRIDLGEQKVENLKWR